MLIDSHTIEYTYVCMTDAYVNKGKLCRFMSFLIIFYSKGLASRSLIGRQFHIMSRRTL